MAEVVSVNSVPVRLTMERWRHIVGQRPELIAYQQEVLDTLLMRQNRWIEDASQRIQREKAPAANGEGEQG